MVFTQAGLGDKLFLTVQELTDVGVEPNYMYKKIARQMSPFQGAPI